MLCGVFCGGNRQKWGGIGKFDASQLLNRTKKLSDVGNSQAVGLQECLTAMRLLGCRLVRKVPVWPLQFWGFGEQNQQLTPKVKIFENPFWKSSMGHRFTCHGQMWWKSAVGKLRKGYLLFSYWYNRNIWLRGTRSCPKFRERCRPIDLCMYQLVRIDAERLICRTPEVITIMPVCELAAYNKCCSQDCQKCIRGLKASLVAQPLQSAVEQYRLSVKDCRKVFAGNRCEKWSYSQAFAYPVHPLHLRIRR